MDRQRVRPGGLAELGPVNWVIGRALSIAARTPNAKLFSTLGRQRKLFRAWLRFSAALMPGGSLPRVETEIVILRVAHLRECAYEMDHHTRLARRAGVTDEIVARVVEGPLHPAWGPRERALLAAVDALVRDRDIDDATWAALSAHYGPPELVELCLLVGQYEMLATTIRVLGIARDFEPR